MKDELTPVQLKLFERGLPTARRMAERYHKKLGPPFEQEDLESGALQGLWLSAREFDPSRGVPFSRFAPLRMKRGLIDEVRRIAPRAQSAYRRALALRYAATAHAHELSDAALELLTLEGVDEMTRGEAERSLDQLMGSFEAAVAIGLLSPVEESQLAEDSDAEDVTEQNLRLKIVLKEIQKLEPRDRTVVMAICVHDRSTVELARELGCTQSWISRTYWRAIGKLRKRLKALE